MLYKDLVRAVARKTGLPARDAQAAIEALSLVVIEETEKNGRCRVAPLGIFEMRTRASRRGRNPATGETIQVGESRSIGFKLASGIRSSL